MDTASGLGAFFSSLLSQLRKVAQPSKWRLYEPSSHITVPLFKHIAMNSLFLSRRISHFSIRPAPSSSVLLRSYHAGRASSVHTAIRKGLRKSNGIGFRGKTEPAADDPRELYRTRNGIPAYDEGAARAKRAAKKDARKAASERVYHDPWDAKQSVGKSWSSRGKASSKDNGRPSVNQSQWSEPLLRSDKSADTKVFGRFGEKIVPTIRKFDPAKPTRFGLGSDSRPQEQSSKTEYQSRSQDSPSSNAYPSLSFGDKSSRSTPEKTSWGTRFTTERPNSFSSNREPAGRFGSSRPNLDTRIDGDAFRRKSEPYDSRPSGRDGRSINRHTEGRPDARSSDRFGNAHSDRSARPYENSSSRHTSNASETRSSGRVRESHFGRDTGRDHDTGSSERSIKLDRSTSGDTTQSNGRHKDGRSAEVGPRVSKIFDKHMPLSIPYTTPASEFLYGTSVVEAAITSPRMPKRKLYKLYIYSGENREDAARDSQMERLARRNGVEVVRVGSDWVRLMDKMSSGRPHNGYILEASPLPRLPVTHLGEFKSDDLQDGFEVSIDHQSREEAAVNGTSNFIRTRKNRSGRKPLVLLLDSIVDPGNLGGIVRTASFLGVSAIAISSRNSASFTPVVLKASAGASENITLFSVNKPAGFIVDSKAAGWRVYAAVAPSKHNDPSMPASISTDDLADPLSEAPCILMLGSEGEGLRWNLRSKADFDLHIQGSGRSYNVDSLNVSVATGILCNSFLSKRNSQVAPAAVEEAADDEASPVNEPERAEAVASSGTLF